MPKGKARKVNPDMYQESAAPQPRSMAPQAVAHRRGGTHRVKDKDRTDSIYDTYNYQELLDATKERSLYRKDMKKVEMAKVLQAHDLEKQRAQRQAIIEREKRQQEEEKDRHRQHAERLAASEAYYKRRIEKEESRARCEIVSDDTLSDAEMEDEHRRIDYIDGHKDENIGQLISDESWDSTSSESTVRSVNQPIVPDCKLRLFEWPYPYMPMPNSTSSLPTLPNQPTETILPERLPWKIPYSPLKVITTKTKQKVFLPGQKYPPGVNPDFVPVLSLRTRSAIRNGILEGVLRNALVEKATDWAERTQISGLGATMYFNLPSRNEFKDLAETYKKWDLENRRLLRVKGRGDGVPADREWRHAQRHINKGKKTNEVYEASQYRPLAVCYIPSYLDFDSNYRGEGQKHAEEHRSLQNLFFIRFPGCDLPHYYFWTRLGEWEDPAKPNAGWDPAKGQEEATAAVFESKNADVQRDSRQPTQEQPRQAWTTIGKHRIRVKRQDAIRDGFSMTSEPTDFASTVTKIERELYSNGLAATLCKYRTKWAENRKTHAWAIFARAIPTLYPSGQMPDAPPVDALEGPQVAIKLATIDTLTDSGKTPFSPLNGDESWTRDDNRFWDVVEVFAEVAGEIVEEEDIPGELECSEDALYRRCSSTFRRSHDRWAARLDQVSPSYVPPTPTSLPKTPIVRNASFEGREEWDERFMLSRCKHPNLTCPFCSMEWETMSPEAKAEHVWSHSDNEGIHRRRLSTEPSPFFTLPPSAQKPNCWSLIPTDSVSDAGADGDIDTPINFRPAKPFFSISARRRNICRSSAQTYATASPLTDIPSQSLRLVHHLPADHDDATYRHNPRSAALSDKHLPPLQIVRRKGASGSTYTDALSSRTSSMVKIPNLNRRKNVGYVRYRDRPVALSVSSIDDRTLKRGTKIKSSVDADATAVIQSKISDVKPAENGKKRKAAKEDLDIEREAKRPGNAMSQINGAKGWCAVM